MGLARVTCPSSSSVARAAISRMSQHCSTYRVFADLRTCWLAMFVRNASCACVCLLNGRHRCR